jgi:hypothetical protein
MEKQSKAEYLAEQAERHRQIQEIFAQMEERHRRADEREARRRARLRRLTLGLLGRS